MFGDNFL